MTMPQPGLLWRALREHCASRNKYGWLSLQTPGQLWARLILARQRLVNGFRVEAMQHLVTNKDDR
jgi:hypothetical protein